MRIEERLTMNIDVTITEVGVERNRPKIRIIGSWLNDLGFEVDSIVTVHYKQGHITFKKVGKGIATYNSIVKGVMQDNSVKVLYVKQVYKHKKYTPYFEVRGKWLADIGFDISQVIEIVVTQDIIDVTTIDLEKAIKKKIFK